MEETNVKLAPPWIQYVNALEAMFGKDPEIQLVYSNDDVTVTLRVDNQAKADALVELLPDVKVFGKRDAEDPDRARKHGDDEGAADPDGIRREPGTAPGDHDQRDPRHDAE